MKKTIVTDHVKLEILENVTAIIALHDIQNNVLWANKAYRDATKISLEEIGDKKCYSLWRIDKPCHNCPVIECIKTGESAEAELNPENQDHWPATQGAWLSRATPLKDNEGNIIGAIEIAFEITNRRKTLNKIEERHFVTLMSVSEAIIATDSKGRIELMNPEAERLTGWTQDEGCGRVLDEVFQVINEDTLQPVDIIATLYKFEGRLPSQNIDLLLISKDGVECPISSSAAPIRIHNGDVLGSVIVFKDQTEKRLVERELRESEKKFQAIAESALDAVIMINNDGNVTYWSPSAEKMFGYSSSEIMGENVHKILMHEKYSEAYEKGFEAFRRTGKGPAIGKVLELTAKHKSGRDIEIEIAVSAINIKEKYWASAIIRDITWRKQIESELINSRKRFDLLMNRLNDVVWTATGDGSKIIEVNNAFEKIYGITADELKSNPGLWLEMVHKDDQKIAKAAYKELFETGHYQAEYRIIRPDGEIRWLRDRRSLIYDDQNKAAQIGGIVNDITELKRNEEEKEKLQVQFLKAQKMDAVGRLAGGVAHDFNNMLSIILGNTQMVLMKLKPSDSLYEELDEIQKASLRSADLVRQLLIFASRQTIAPQVLNLNEAISATLKMLKRLIGEDIEVLWKPDKNLWPVKIDPSQLDQILANLAVNSRDAIAGVGKLIIETKNICFDADYYAPFFDIAPGDYVMLSVSDNGSGMNKETMDNIFEPFFTTKGPGKGTGLGLATVYGIAKQNKGFIKVYSEIGQGTTFKIYFPKATSAVDEIDDVQDLEIVRGREETILLVEDEPQILSMLKRFLEGINYRVLIANNPMKALQLIKDYPERIHLVLTDVVMPDMNGRELVEQLMKIRPGMKCIFMSGYTADIIEHHVDIEENLLLVQKPLDVKQFSSKLREVLKSE